MNRRAFTSAFLVGLIVQPWCVWARQHDSPEPVLTGLRESEPFPISHADATKVPRKFRRQIVTYATQHESGSIVVDTHQRFLYLVLGGGRALRYGIGVGREGFAWSGVAKVGRKAEWPRWTPPKEMVARDPFAAEWADGMPGGPNNPLGARALYLFANGIDTLYRVHGTNQRKSIGQAVSSGCVRLLNTDIIHLHERVGVGTKVVVLPPQEPMRVAIKQPPTAKLVQKGERTPQRLVRKTNFNLRRSQVREP